MARDGKPVAADPLRGYSQKSHARPRPSTRESAPSSATEVGPEPPTLFSRQPTPAYSALPSPGQPCNTRPHEDMSTQGAWLGLGSDIAFMSVALGSPWHRYRFPRSRSSRYR